jgi:hypothetical protein
MARNYRTAQGKVIDMAGLAARNEKVRAVGNMKVNARGDTIDGNNKVITPVTQKVGASYQKTVGNKSAHTKAPSKPVTNKAPVPVKEELTNEELELESSFDDIEIEKIKAAEKKK